MKVTRPHPIEIEEYAGRICIALSHDRDEKYKQTCSSAVQTESAPPDLQSLS